MQRKTEIWVIAIFLVVLVVAVIAAAFLSGKVAPQTGNAVNPTTVPALTSADWTKGNTASKVSLIEYGDFECPACAEYQPLVQQILSKYGDRIVFSFRNFPLYQIHPDAMISSQAAEAAGLQGKYWEMHDLLYTKQNEWVTASPDAVVAKYFDGYAQSLGLDVAKFDTDINSNTVKNKVQKDLGTGNAAQIDHTPTYFINLTQIANPTSYAELSGELDAALASSTVQ
jgi:protein-disulfide isomerase